MIGRLVFLLPVIALLCSGNIAAQTTAFNYQGRLGTVATPRMAHFRCSSNYSTLYRAERKSARL
jgi:hypothetical protein